MSRVVPLLMLAASAACAHGPGFLRRGSAAPSPEDSLFASAVAQLGPNSKPASIDSAVAALDRYLALRGPQRHTNEAVALRHLAGQAQRLARVEAALQLAREAPVEARRDTEPAPKPRSDEAVKEIQRLREELAKANEELERIKKRLATPKP